ncbi:aldo/keto reductase [Amycolatopsis sp. cmx-11-32]|uniref:aldo/keto reductase n=1 Tax=Amycolatopsis sp. cmx-11-32 TaxID=2785796 RepID=UPI0039E6A018
MVVLVYSPLGSGLLTGSFIPETTFEKTDWRSRSSGFTGETFRHNLAIVDKHEDFAADEGTSVSRLAIAWTLVQPGVHVAIVGAPTADVDLTTDDFAEIDRLTADAVPVSGASPEGIARA